MNSNTTTQTKPGELPLIILSLVAFGLCAAVWASLVLFIPSRGWIELISIPIMFLVLLAVDWHKWDMGYLEQNAQLSVDVLQPSLFCVLIFAPPIYIGLATTINSYNFAGVVAGGIGSAAGVYVLRKKHEADEQERDTFGTIGIFICWFAILLLVSLASSHHVPKQTLLHTNGEIRYASQPTVVRPWLHDQPLTTSIRSQQIVIDIQLEDTWQITASAWPYDPSWNTTNTWQRWLNLPNRAFTSDDFPTLEYEESPKEYVEGILQRRYPFLDWNTKVSRTEVWE